MTTPQALGREALAALLVAAAGATLAPLVGAGSWVVALALGLVGAGLAAAWQVTGKAWAFWAALAAVAGALLVPVTFPLALGPRLLLGVAGLALLWALESGHLALRWGREDTEAGQAALSESRRRLRWVLASTGALLFALLLVPVWADLVFPSYLATSVELGGAWGLVVLGGTISLVLLGVARLRGARA